MGLVDVGLQTGERKETLSKQWTFSPSGPVVTDLGTVSVSGLSQEGRAHLLSRAARVQLGGRVVVQRSSTI